MSIPRGLSPFIAHYVTESAVYDFKSKTVVIRSPKNDSEIEYPLALPSVVAEAKIALSNKAFIPQLLRQGYFPKLVGNKVKLIQPRDQESVDPNLLGRLQILCDQTASVLKITRQSTEFDLLTEFKDAVLAEKYDLAESLIGALRKRRETENIKRIQAIFLRIIHKPQEAAKIFSDLSSESILKDTAEQTSEDLEDALACTPSDGSLLKIYEKMHESQPMRLWVMYLFAYLHEPDPVIAKKWLARAKKYGPQEVLLILGDEQLKDEDALEQAKKLQEANKSPRGELLRDSLRVPRSPREERRTSPRANTLVQAVKSAMTLSRSSADDVEEYPKSPDTRLRVPLSRQSRSSGAEVAGSPSEGRSFFESSANTIRQALKGRSRTNTLVSAPAEEEKKAPPKKDSGYKHYKWQLESLLKSNGNDSTLIKMLNSLRELYLETKQWRKLEVITQLLVQKDPSVESRLNYADALKRNGKIEEAAKYLYENVKRAYEESRLEDVGEYIKKIDEVDPKRAFFSSNIKKILYLLRPSTPRAKEFEAPPLETGTKDYISPNCFFMDHPTYLACYVEVDRICLIAKDHVRVEIPATDEFVDYSLTMPFDSTLTSHDVLSKTGLIRKYLRKGYILDIGENDVALKAPTKGLVTAPFRKAAELLIEQVGADSIEIKIRNALLGFLDNLDTSPALAEEALHKGMECQPSSDIYELWMGFNKLAADFLSARQKMEQAAVVYKSLSYHAKDPEQKLSYLEKAFFCTPTETHLEAELSRCDMSDRRKQHLYLAAFLKVLGTAKAATFLAKTSKGDPYINLAQLNQIARKEKDRRVEIFARIFQIYKRQDSLLAKFYRTCGWIEENASRDELKSGITELLASVGDQKTKKRVALQILDNLIETKSYAVAEVALEIIVEQLRKSSSMEWKDTHPNSQLRFEGDNGAFGRREFIIFNAQENISKLNNTMSRLLSIYFNANKHEKIAAVTQLSFKKCETFESTCIQAISAQGKIKEAARTAFDIAFELVVDKSFDRAQKSLKELEMLDLDYKYFNAEEKFIIDLMKKAE